MRTPSRTGIFWSALALVSMAPGQASANYLDKAEKALRGKNPQKAFEILKNAKEPEAPYYIGSLATKGLITDCDLNCALLWFQKSAIRQHPPSLREIGVLYFNDDQKEVGISYLKEAARWNDSNSAEVLKQMGENVPEPDLWNAKQIQLRTEENRKRQEASLARARAQEELLGVLLVGLLVAGATSSAGAAPSMVYHPPSESLTSRRRPQPQWAPLASPDALGPPPMQVWPRSGQVPSQSSNSASTPFPTSPRLCPDGTYVAGGECRLAPNGTYLPGPATLAPNGTYVVARPQLAPDGTYVGGGGRVTLCPDGTYVSGTRCILTPNGKYLGGS